MSCYNKNLRSTLLIFKKKFWFREFSSIRAEGRLSRFSVAIVLSPSTVTFRSGTFLCFRSFHVSEKIGDKKCSAYLDSVWGTLSPHSTETFLEENFWVSENFCYRNIIRLRRGGGGRGVTWFSVEIVCLTIPQRFVGEPICGSETIRYGKTLWIKGGG